MMCEFLPPEQVSGKKQIIWRLDELLGIFQVWSLRSILPSRAIYFVN